ncbi:MAG: hypothetical protein AAF752_13725, partial [Bacteroidota bacterium]
VSNPSRRAADDSEVLAEAILLRQQSDHLDPSSLHLDEALQPVVEGALRRAVDEDPEGIAESIYPSLMPAVRRAISQSFERLRQQITRALDERFSARSLNWRWQAIRTGQSFGDVVLLNTLAYRVEAVYAIHKVSGLPVLYASVLENDEDDAALKTAMFTALQAYVEDSFDDGTGTDLESVQMGEREVLVEDAGATRLMAVVRGEPPVDLRESLQAVLDRFNLRHARDLRSYDGDSAPFEGSRPLLESALVSRLKSEDAEEPPSSGRRFWTIAGLLFSLVVGALAFFAIRDSLRWQDLVRSLASVPGVELISADRPELTALLDPLAPAPEQLLRCEEPGSYVSRCRLQRDEIEAQWIEFRSPAPEIALERAYRVLAPPAGTSLELEAAALTVTGSPDATWASTAQRLAPLIPGIDTLQVQLDRSARERLDLLRRQIQDVELTFAEGSAALAAGQAVEIQRLVTDIASAYTLSQELGGTVTLVVTGHATPTGSEAINRQLVQERARQALAMLSSSGLRPLLSAQEPLQTDLQSGVLSGRTASFDIRLTPP